MKNRNVCKGCKYQIKSYSIPFFIGSCDYLAQTGKSRIKTEAENGGYKTDSCICYEVGTRKRGGLPPKEA